MKSSRLAGHRLVHSSRGQGDTHLISSQSWQWKFRKTHRNPFAFRITGAEARFDVFFSPTAGISFLKTKMLFRKSMNWHWMTSVEDLFKGAGEWKVDWVLLRMLFRQLKKKNFFERLLHVGHGTELGKPPKKMWISWPKTMATKISQKVWDYRSPPYLGNIPKNEKKIFWVLP